MRPLLLPTLFVALSALSPALAQDAPRQLLLRIEGGDNPPKSIEVSGADIQVILDDYADPLPIAPDGYDSDPMTLTINWPDERSASLPALLFPMFGGLTMKVYAQRSEFTPDTLRAADDLCYHTSVSSVRGAFRTMFSCGQWAHFLDTPLDHWTKAHLRALRGWFDGAYYLFTKVRPTSGVGLSPWGLPPDLVKALDEVVEAIDVTHTRTEESFAPYLRLADIRQALEENDRWELKLYGVVAQLASRGDWVEADLVNKRVMAAYARIVGNGKPVAIDGVDQIGLTKNAELIAAKLPARPE